jgi:hypothetical protein
MRRRGIFLIVLVVVVVLGLLVRKAIDDEDEDDWMALNTYLGNPPNAMRPAPAS